MNDWKSIIDIAQTAPILLLFYILWKGGVIRFNTKNSNKPNGYQAQIDDLKDHAGIANKEMGNIRKDISTIKEDISFIKGKLSNK